jgi:hypothetical protein
LCVRIISELKLFTKSLIWIAWNWQNGLSSPTPNDIYMNNKKKSLRPYSRLSRPEPLLFLPSSPSVVLTRLSGPRSRPTNFFCVGNRTRDPRICIQELWPLDHRGGPYTMYTPYEMLLAENIFFMTLSISNQNHSDSIS